jgi:predicted amidohydrolase YtcJ
MGHPRDGGGRRLIVEAKRVITLDPDRPEATAVAVEDGRVVASGPVEAFDTWAGGRVPRLRLPLGVVYPGFVESHAHLMSMGMQAEALYVGSPPCRSVADILDRVRERAAALQPGTWVVGVHYDDTLLREMRPPTADELTWAAPDHPVFLSHMSGHAAVANWPALERAGVDAATDAEGLVRDGVGRPTGELREGAVRLVARHLPRPTVADRVRWIERASRECLRVGVTAMADSALGGDDPDQARDIWQAYRQAGSEGLLRVRTQLFPTLAGRAHLPIRWSDPMLSIGPVKLFADGSIQARTGALSAPYHDRPDLVVAPFWREEDLADVLADLRREGRQVATHANGDAAIDTVLKAYARALGEGRRADHRWRIEHAQTARPDQLDRMRALGVLPSFFVAHVELFGDRHRDLFLGPRRAEGISPLASALARGIPFSLHSDAPVSRLNPLAAIRTAVLRRTSSGAVLGPAERIAAGPALCAYTAWAAHLGRREHEVGSLAPGRWADMVLLSRDLEAVGSGEEPQVMAALVGGEPAWVAPGCALERGGAS